MQCNDQEYCSNIAIEPDNKGVTQTTDTIFNYYMTAKFRSSYTSFRLLDEIVLTNHHVFVFKPFSPFFQTFSNTIDRLVDSGFFAPLSKWFSFKRKYENMGPQVLTLNHLGLGFIACLIPLGVAFVVFWLELVLSSKKLYHQRKTLGSRFLLSKLY